MRRFVIVLASLAVVSLVVPSIGLALPAPGDSGAGVLCVYSAQDFTTAANVMDVAAFTPFSFYAGIYAPRAPSNSIRGFEFSWHMQPDHAADFVVSSVELPPEALNLGTNFNFLVGLGTPVAATGNFIQLVKINGVFLAAPTATFVFVGPATPSSVPGFPCYNDGGDVALLFHLVPNSNSEGFGNPIFGFNMPVATESQTWGAVKALFN